MINTFFYETNIGKIGIAEEDGEIVKLFFSSSKNSDEYNICETKILIEAFEQLNEYLTGRRQSFDLPLNPIGTEFQKRLWQKLLEIPYGETWSYKRLASEIGNEKACRAVGLANNRNPIAIFIPCHRVIGSNGDLTGYAGGLGLKKELLDLENGSVA